MKPPDGTTWTRIKGPEGFATYRMDLTVPPSERCNFCPRAYAVLLPGGVAACSDHLPDCLITPCASFSGVVQKIGYPKKGTK